MIFLIAIDHRKDGYNSNYQDKYSFASLFSLRNHYTKGMSRKQVLFSEFSDISYCLQIEKPPPGEPGGGKNFIC
jgi:hypothetical protein